MFGRSLGPGQRPFIYRNSDETPAIVFEILRQTVTKAIKPLPLGHASRQYFGFESIKFHQKVFSEGEPNKTKTDSGKLSCSLKNICNH